MHTTKDHHRFIKIVHKRARQTPEPAERKAAHAAAPSAELPKPAERKAAHAAAPSAELPKPAERKAAHAAAPSAALPKPAERKAAVESDHSQSDSDEDWGNEIEQRMYIVISNAKDMSWEGIPLASLPEALQLEDEDEAFTESDIERVVRERMCHCASVRSIGGCKTITFQ